MSTTVRGGSGDDTIFIGGHTAAGAGSSNTAFYAGDGTDSLKAQGRGISVYGGSSADSTSDGADTLSLTNLYDSTVYGAAGADSFILSNNIDSVRIEGGAGASEFSGSGTLSDTTVLGGAAADSLTLGGTVDGYFDGAAGADTLIFEAVTGASGSETTILGGAGNDTIGSGADFAYVSLVGGTGADSIYTAAGGDNATNSTLLGGDGNDTLQFAGGATSTRR